MPKILESYFFPQKSSLLLRALSKTSEARELLDAMDIVDRDNSSLSLTGDFH